MNIYGMYVHNDSKVPFWITRITWGNTIAKVIFVGPLNGKPPYYGNPEVIAEFYDLSTGRLKNSESITTAGTYKTWRLAQAPDWAK